MKIILRLLLSAVIACAMTTPVFAGPVLSLQPHPGKLHPPENFTVDIVISGMQAGGPNMLLGAFDLTLTYSAAMLQLTGASSLGTALGNPNDATQTITGVDASTPGFFRIYEVSLLEASNTSCIFCTGPYLDDLQGDSFTLATISFFAPGLAGSSYVTFGLDRGSAILGDAAGDPIAGVAFPADLIVPIPEPDEWLLLATAGFAALLARKRRAQHQIGNRSVMHRIEFLASTAWACCFRLVRSLRLAKGAWSGSYPTMAMAMALGLALSCPADPALAATPSHARVFVTPAANLPVLRGAIESLGGNVLDFTAERAFLVRIDPGMAGAVGALTGVRLVVVVPAPTEQLTPPTPRLGNRAATPAEQAAITASYTNTLAVAPNALSLERASLAPSGLRAQAVRPSRVDNSLSIFMPPVDSQQFSDCTAWATCYYYSTYTQANDEGADVSKGLGDARARAYIASPSFLYALINGGADLGANTQYAVARLIDQGCASQAAWPYSRTDYTTWPSEAAWLDAQKFRGTQARQIGVRDADGTGSGMELLKQHLANGHIAVTISDVYANWYIGFRNNAPAGISNGVLYSTSGQAYIGSHALTIVGYDNNRPYTVNGVERRGAILVANSWGANWGVSNSSGAGGGYFWVSYDYAMNQSNGFNIALYIEDRANYRPQLYAAAGLVSSQRGQLRFWGGTGNPLSPHFLSYKALDNYGGTALGIDASRRVVVDVSDGIAAMDANDPAFVRLTVSASAPAQISNADFFASFLGRAIPAPNMPVIVGPGQPGTASVLIRSPIVSLVGDKDGYIAGGPRDVPPRSQVVQDLLDEGAATPGQAPGVDLDEGGNDRSVGMTHVFALPGKARVTGATVKLRIRGTNALVSNDSILYRDSAFVRTGLRLPLIALRDLKPLSGRQPTTGEDVELEINLAKVPVRTIDRPDFQPGGTLPPRPDEYRNLLPLLRGGQFDLVLGDDAMVDFSELTVTFVSASARTGDLNGDGAVDTSDLALIMDAINTVASGIDDPRDLDRDGRITVLDARKLALLCTLAQCARR